METAVDQSCLRPVTSGHLSLENDVSLQNLRTQYLLSRVTLYFWNQQ